MWDRTANESDGSIRISTKVDATGYVEGIKKISSKQMQLTNDIKKTEVQIQKLQNEMAQLGEQKVPTSEFSEIQKQITDTETKLNGLIEKEQQFIASGGKTSSTAFSKMELSIEELSNSLPFLKGELQDLIDKDQAFTSGTKTDTYLKKAADLAVLNDKVGVYKQKLLEASQKETSLSKKFGTFIREAKSGFSKLGAVVKKTFSRINASTSKSSGMLGGFASRLKGITLSLLVFNWITKGFNAMVESIKEGTKELAQYSDEYNAELTGLKTATATLKSSFAAAFQPIMSMLIPYLVKLCEWLTRAVNLMNQFLSALSGKNTWIKAVKTTQNYAAGITSVGDSAKKAEKKLEGYLSPIDEINKYQSEEDTSGGGSDIGTTIFDTLPIKLSKFMQSLLDAINSGDWYKVGALIAEKLNDSMERIDWTKIKARAKEIASNIGNFINGFTLNFNWRLFGSTIGEGINTGLIFAYTLLTTTQWDKIGRKLAEGLSGVTDTIDWKLVGSTLARGLNAAFSLIYGFISNYDWKKLGSELSTALNTFMKIVDWEKVGKTIGVFIQGIMDFVIGFLKNLNLAGIISAVKSIFKGIFSEIDKAELVAILAVILSSVLVISFAKMAIKNIVTTWVTSSLIPSLIGAITGTASTTAVTGATSSLVAGSASTGLAGVTAGSLASSAAVFAGSVAACILTAIVGEEIGLQINNAIERGMGEEPMFNNSLEMWEYISGINSDDVKGAFQLMGEDISKAFKEGWIGQAFNGWGQGIKDESTSVTEKTTVDANSIQKNISNSTATAKADAERNFNGMSSSVSESMNAVKSASSDMSSKVKTNASSMSNGVSSSMSSVTTSLDRTKSKAADLGTYGGSGMTKFRDSAKDMSESVCSFMDAVIQSIGAAIDKLKEFFEQKSNVGSTTPNVSSARSIINSVSPAYKLPGIATGTVLPAGISRYIATLREKSQDDDQSGTLANMVQALKQVIGDKASDAGTQVINLVLDGMTITQVVIKNGKVIAMRNGKSPFV